MIYEKQISINQQPTNNEFSNIALVACVAAVQASGHSDHGVEHWAPAHYKFNYGVSDPHTGDQKSQSEVREGDVVKGSYSLHEIDGTIRVVEYTADPHNGFNAVVKRVGHAAHPIAHPHGAAYSHNLVAGHSHHGHGAVSVQNNNLAAGHGLINGLGIYGGQQTWGNGIVGSVVAHGHGAVSSNSLSGHGLVGGYGSWAGNQGSWTGAYGHGGANVNGLWAQY